MARVSKEFADNFDLVTRTWIGRGDHTESEIAKLKDALRVELAPGPGLPHPVINGERVQGWRPLSHEQRVDAYTKAFADWAAEIRRDMVRKERIKAEVREHRESLGVAA